MRREYKGGERSRRWDGLTRAAADLHWVSSGPTLLSRELAGLRRRETPQTGAR